MATRVPLLQYADDTMFLLKGTMEATKNISAMLYIFSDFSRSLSQPIKIHASDLRSLLKGGLGI